MLADKDKVISDLRQADAANRVHIARVEADASAERKARLRVEAELAAAEAQLATLRDPRVMAAALVPSTTLISEIPAKPVSKRKNTGNREDNQVIAELRAELSQVSKQNTAYRGEIDGLHAEIAELRETVARTSGQPGTDAKPRSGCWTFDDLVEAHYR